MLRKNHDYIETLRTIVRQKRMILFDFYVYLNLTMRITMKVSKKQTSAQRTHILKGMIYNQTGQASKVSTF